MTHTVFHVSFFGGLYLHRFKSQLISRIVAHEKNSTTKKTLPSPNKTTLVSNIVKALIRGQLPRFRQCFAGWAYVGWSNHNIITSCCWPTWFEQTAVCVSKKNVPFGKHQKKQRIFHLLLHFPMTKDHRI